MQAAIVTLAVRHRVSRRDTTELARELFGVELATGSVDTIVQRTGEALAAPHTRLEQQIKSAPVVNIDETGWKTAGGNRTLWAALDRQADSGWGTCSATAEHREFHRALQSFLIPSATRKSAILPAITLRSVLPEDHDK